MLHKMYQHCIKFVLLLAMLILSTVLGSLVFNCSSSEDCKRLGFGFECVKPICQCKIGNRYDNTSKTCKADNGKLCYKDVHCGVSLSNCVKNKCTCTDGYIYKEDIRICGALHGTDCASDRGCTEDYNFCKRQGDKQTCQCSERYIYHNDGVRKYCKALYGASCASTDCYDMFTTCRGGKCACDMGYAYNPLLKSCKAKYGSKCLNKPHCRAADRTDCIHQQCLCIAGFRHKDGFCKAELGRGCGASTECIDNYSECNDRSFVCTCKNGYLRTSSNKNPCQALVGSRCSQDMDCHDLNSSCETNGSSTCVCKSSFLAHPVTRICLARIGSRCKSRSDCYSRNSACSRGTCECFEGFKLTRQNCLAVYQGYCTVKSDCADSQSMCSSGRCICMSGYMYDPSLSTCRVAIGGDCSADGQCVSNASCANGTICMCSARFVNQDKLCKGLFGVRCAHPSHCFGPYAECANNRCACRSGHHRSGNSCKVALMSFCASSGDCYGKNVECRSKTCQCTQYYESRTAPPRLCLASFGVACSSNGDCASDVCNTDRRCFCGHGRKFSNISRSCKALHGQNCSHSTVCYDSASSCVSSKCNCSSGYGYSEILQRCQDIDDCKPDPCQNDGTCTNHVGRYECKCPKLFAGRDCQISTDFCRKATCDNGGTCVNMPTKFFCDCTRGFLGRNCRVTAPTELCDLVRIKLAVSPSKSIKTQEFHEKVGFGLAVALELAYCRNNTLRAECEPLVRRRKRRSGLQRHKDWSVQVDRAVRKLANKEDVSVLFTARYKHRLQEPRVITFLCSLLQPMELVVKIGHKVLQKPSTVKSSVENHHLCWIRSVFELRQLSVTRHDQMSTFIQERLKDAVQTALRIRERRMVSIGSLAAATSPENDNTYSNTLVVVVDVRRFQSNNTVEVIYYAVLKDNCYSAMEMSYLLNNFTVDQFRRIILWTPLIIAQAYNRTDQSSEEEYKSAFVIATKMSAAVNLKSSSVMSRVERKLTEMMAFILGTQELPPAPNRRAKRSYTLDMVTCKLLKMARVNSTSSSVLLIAYATKQGKVLDPHRIVILLKSVDTDTLSIKLNTVVDSSVVAYVYNGDDVPNVTLSSRTHRATAATTTDTLFCSGTSTFSPRHATQSMRYWVRTVTKHLSVETVASVQKRLSLLLVLVFQNQSRNQHNICAKVVRMGKVNMTSDLTETIYYGLKDGQPVRAITLANLLVSYDIQELAVTLHQVIHVKAEVYGQDQTPGANGASSGKEFVVAFLENYVERKVDFSQTILKVILTTCENTVAKVVLATPSSNILHRKVTVHPDQATTVIIPYSLMLKGTQLTYKSLRVSSNVDIVVTAVNHDSLSQDAYTVQPIGRFGHVYYVMSYWPSSLHTQFAIIAIADNTRVDIKFVKELQVSLRLNGQRYNNNMDVVMRQNETLQVQSLEDLSGTVVKATKTIAVYSGNICTNVRGKSHDHLVDQLLPDKYQGRSFIIIPYTTDLSRGTLVKMLATENDTIIYYPSKELDIKLETAGDHHSLYWDATNVRLRNEGHFLFSNKPLVVAMFSYSGNADTQDDVGDPSMSMVPPMSAYQSRYRFTLPADNQYTHYVRLAIENPEFEGLKLDGMSLSSTIHWSVVPGTAPAIVTATFKLKPGTYSLHHNNPFMTFLLHLYGAATHESYSHYAGSCRRRFVHTIPKSKPAVHPSTAAMSEVYTTPAWRTARLRSSAAVTKAAVTKTMVTKAAVTKVAVTNTSVTNTPATKSAVTKAAVTKASTKVATTKAAVTKLATATPTSLAASTARERTAEEISQNTTNRSSTIKSEPDVLSTTASVTPTASSHYSAKSASSTTLTEPTIISGADSDRNSTKSRSFPFAAHAALSRGDVTQPYWLAMTIRKEEGPLTDLEHYLETSLLNLYIAALQMRRKRHTLMGKLHRGKRYAQHRSLRLQVVKCISVDEFRCDLIFYLTQNYIEVHPAHVESVYSRLTASHLINYLSKVTVLSRIRVYIISVNSPTATTEVENQSATTLNTSGLSVEEAVLPGTNPADSPMPITGWVVGAIALTCLFVGASLYILNNVVTNSKEDQTWIQRRLSKDHPRVPIPGGSKKDSTGSSKSDRNKSADQTKTRRDQSPTSDPPTVSGVVASGDRPLPLPSTKKKLTPRKKIRSKEEKEELNSEEKTDGEKDVEDSEGGSELREMEAAAEFGMLGAMDKAKNKDKLRRRARLRKKQTSGTRTMKRPLPSPPKTKSSCRPRRLPSTTTKRSKC